MPSAREAVTGGSLTGGGRRPRPSDQTPLTLQDVKTYLRAEAASQNGFETMALFAVSILAGSKSNQNCLE